VTLAPDVSRGAGDALSRLVGDVDAFAAEHWGHRPLLRRGAWSADTPLSVDDVDRLLTASGLRWPAFRLVREGTTLPASACTRTGRIGGRSVGDLADAALVLEHVHQGATLVLQGLHRYHPPVTALCDELEEGLGHPVQANAYLTPPGSRGLNVHHDTHDVLALQTHGRKHWVVHEPAVVAPLPSQPWSSERHTPGPLVLDTRLEPGDVLYLPRGAPHAAETVGEVSLHLTLGVRAVTWYDVVQRAAGRLGDDPALREALPLEYARDPERLAELLGDRLNAAARGLERVDVDRLAADLVAERRRSRRPAMRGRLRELVALDALDDGTVVRRRDRQPVEVDRRDDRVVVRLADRDVALPVAAADVVELLLDGSARRVGDLAAWLDHESRLVLARRLVREGALTTGDAPRD
jgi:bifunctional lysine-specific demethylase and histidyl-hydroxylase NO66